MCPTHACMRNEVYLEYLAVVQGLDLTSFKIIVALSDIYGQEKILNLRIHLHHCLLRFHSICQKSLDFSC